MQLEINGMLGKNAISQISADTHLGFYSQMFLVPKKDGKQRPVINLKRLNHSVLTEHFKMEGIHMLKDLLKQGDWMAKIVLKDAYFMVPMASEDREFLRFQWKDKAYQFNCLPFGLSSAPWVFTKTTRPVMAILWQLGLRLIIYIDDILLMAETVTAKGSHHGDGIPVGKPRIRNQLPQVSTEPNSGDRIPGVRDQLPHNGAEAPRGQDQEDKERGRTTPAIANRFNPCTLQIAWENECSHAGHSHGSTVLQKPTVMPPRGPPGVTQLRLNNDTDGTSQRGTGVVERPLHSVADACSPSLTIETDASTTGWGAVCEGVRTGGPWNARERQMHINCLELLAAHLAVQSFAKHRTNLTILLDGQYVSSDIHQQTRGDGLPRTDCPSQETLAVVHGEEHCPQGSTSARCSKHHSRQRVESHERSDRLDALSNSLQQDQSDTWSFGRRSVCQQTDPPAPSLCELETRPHDNGNRCLHNGLGHDERVRQPSVEPHREGSGSDPPTTSRACTSGTRVESSSVVPSTAGDVGSHATTTSPEGGPGAANTPRQLPRDNSDASRVGCLRKQYQSCQVSEEATELLLASWRQKSSKTYDSLFGKWVSWCSERGSDPISGPIGDVVNFLASLYHQGYQYRSLNAYRSAISSVHEKTDGYEVGQHPLVSRLLKGVFHKRPPTPRYAQTWDVNVVTTYLESLGENEGLSLANLTFKTLMLMALTRPSRSADLSGLDLQYRRFLPEVVTFQPSKLAKQSRVSKPLSDFFFPAFPHNRLLCPVVTLRAYEERTAPLREGGTPAKTTLFLTTVKPHGPAASSTIAQWLKTLLGKAGIDTGIFTAHSVRGASSTAAHNAGVTTGDTMNAADWSSQSVFRKF